MFLPLEQKKSVGYIPHTDGEKVQRFTELSCADRLKEVQLSFGVVQPQDERINLTIAGMYGMSKRPHGICLIINNEKFEKQSERKGSNIDEYNLVLTFRHLGYIVEVHRDCKVLKMQEIIEKIRKENHSSYDSFVCCILSYGNTSHVYGSDSTSVVLDDITSRFNGKNCKSLAGKPKLFFLQACYEDRAVHVQSDSGNSGTVEEMLTHPGVRITSDSASQKLPIATDFFFSYDTPINSVALRDLDNGSWYISELCKSLTSYGTFGSLADIVTRTNDKVAHGYSSKGFQQAPDFNSRLRKDVFFF